MCSFQVTVHVLLVYQRVCEYQNKHFNFLCKSHKHVGVVGIQHKINMEMILLNYWKINLSLNYTIFILKDTQINCIFYFPCR